MAKDTNPLVTYFLQPGSISLAVSLTKLSATQHTRFFWRWERFIPREYWRTGAPTDIQVGAVTANDLAYANFSNSFNILSQLCWSCKSCCFYTAFTWLWLVFWFQHQTLGNDYKFELIQTCQTLLLRSFENHQQHHLGICIPLEMYAFMHVHLQWQSFLLEVFGLQVLDFSQQHFLLTYNVNIQCNNKDCSDSFHFLFLASLWKKPPPKKKKNKYKKPIWIPLWKIQKPNTGNFGAQTYRNCFPSLLPNQLLRNPKITLSNSVYNAPSLAVLANSVQYISTTFSCSWAAFSPSNSNLYYYSSLCCSQC